MDALVAPSTAGYVPGALREPGLRCVDIPSFALSVYDLRMTIALNELPADDFDALVQQPISARAGEHALTLTLESVWRSPYPTGRAIPGFSLFLRGPLEVKLNQGIITLTHPAHGDLELFMTPIGRDAQGCRYEIVFN